MAVAGKNSLIRWSSAAVPFSSQATSNNSSQIYSISSTTIHDLPWAHNAAITVRTSGGVVSSTSYLINRLNGSIQFVSTGQIPSGTVTISGSYLPLKTITQAHEYSYTITATNEPDTVFGSSYVTRKQLLQDMVASFSQWYTSSAGDHFGVAMRSTSKLPFVFEAYTDRSTSFEVRAWMLPNANDIESAVNSLVDDTVTLDGTIDASLRMYTFSTAGD